MGEEVKELLESIRVDLSKHAQESREREVRITERVEEVAALARRANEKADLAHARALEAKHAAGRASIDAEGGDEALMAQMSSLSVVVNGHAKQLETHAKTQEEQRKIDAKARRFWRTVQPLLIAVVLAILNQLTGALQRRGIDIQLGPSPAEASSTHAR